MGADGEVHGRIDADTFRIWKGTKHPDEAFEVLAYLITTGGDKLLPAYGAMPAIRFQDPGLLRQESRGLSVRDQGKLGCLHSGFGLPGYPKFRAIPAELHQGQRPLRHLL